VTLRIRPILTAAAISLLALAPMARTESLAGSYLAASQADLQNDYAAAARFYGLALARDPDNLGLMQSLLLSDIGLGHIDKGLPIAERMLAKSADSQLAQLVILAKYVRAGDFLAANKLFNDGAKFSPLLDGLVRGWIDLGDGRMSDALAQFDKMAENTTMKVFSDYHEALALAVVGDFEATEKILRGNNGQPVRIGRGSLIAHIQVLSQLDRRDDAIAAIDVALNGSGDLELMALRTRLENGETLPFETVRTANDGVAEVFVTLASVLAGQQNERFGLIYGRLAEYLRPGSVRAILMVADTLDTQGQYNLAVKSYNQVPANDPRFYSAEIGRAGALQSAGKADAAIEVLRNLAKAHPTVPTVFTSLGDALRRQSQFADASIAYDSAIALLPDAKPNHWFLYYARGITFERQGEWDKAEADFRYALKLSPDQPLVLNYLGYGLVEKGLKMDEAQKMIETAVQKKPNDGYITDSLGWVLFQIGKYTEAVSPLERAVELMPVDPIINDHLGDVYWMVGRKNEARFQWSRALSFGPDDTEKARIRKKLDVGLDEVRKVEIKTSGTNN